MTNERKKSAQSPAAFASRFNTEIKTRNRERRSASRRLAAAQAGADSGRNDLLPPLELVDVRLDDLKLSQRRLRKRDPAHIREVANSIARLGYSKPILIGPDNEVIDGETVIEGVRLLGLDRLSCIRVGHLNDSERRLLRLAINRLAEKGEWDFEALRRGAQEPRQTVLRRRALVLYSPEAKILGLRSGVGHGSFYDRRHAPVVVLCWRNPQHPAKSRSGVRSVDLRRGHNPIALRSSNSASPSPWSFPVIGHGDVINPVYFVSTTWVASQRRARPWLRWRRSTRRKTQYAALAIVLTFCQKYLEYQRFHALSRLVL